MNILITTPVGRTENGEMIDYFPSRWSGNSGKYKSTSFYPYNLAYLSSYLKVRTSFDVKMIDTNFYGIDAEEYINIIINNSPDVLIVEIDAIIHKKQIQIIKKIKQLLGKDITVIVAGPTPTVLPNLFLENGCDFVALGEFEESITELILQNFNPTTEGIYPNKRRKLIDLNKLPFPEDKDIKRRNYCRYYGSEFNEVELFATRGCPYMCNFCVYANIYAGKPSFRTRDVHSVIEEIKYLRSTIKNLEGFFFNEESHTANTQYIYTLCHAIIDCGLNDFKYNCMTNYDTLNKELLTLMKEAGYYKVRIGIETLNSESATFITPSNIKANHKRLMETLEICRDLGIKVYATISVGAKESSYEKDMRSLDTLKFLYENNYIQEFQLSINTPMPGTPFYNECQEKGYLIKDIDYDGAQASSISYPHYNAQEIAKCFQEINTFRHECIKLNMEKGIRYSMYDKTWSKPVYDINNRKPYLQK